MGLKKESVGHYILTNIGTLGMQQGFGPHCPPMRAMGLSCIGVVQKKAVVIDDEIVIQDMMNTTQTGDHRYGDAAIWMPFQKVLIGYIADAKNFHPEDYKKEAVHWTEKKTSA